MDNPVEAVRFVWDALDTPEDALAREGMGDLHDALVPHLRNWQTSSDGGDRNLLMVSAVGSINYGTVVASSDLDMKAVYLPDLRDFYHGKFPKFSFVTPRFDCELHPAHHFCQHVLKGNINFFEPLYASACLARPDFIYLMRTVLTPMVEMNIKMTALASYWTAMQQNKGVSYVAGEESWGSKKASHAIRILAFLTHLLDTGEFNIETAEPFRTAVVQLKTGDMPWHEYAGLFDTMRDVVQGMMFKRFESGSDFEFTDRVEELDGKDSPQWNELQAELDNELMAQVRSPIEERAQNQLQAQYR